MEDYGFTQSLLCILLSLLIIWVTKYYLDTRKVYKLAKLIPGPKGYPIVGNLLDFLGGSMEKFYPKLLNYFDTNPEIFKLWLGPKLQIGVSKPEYLEIILNHKHCLEKDVLYDIAKKLLGNGLLCAPVSTWKKHRKLMNPLFNQKILESFIPDITKNSKILVNVLEENTNNKNLDIYEMFHNFSTSCICKAVMGVDVNLQIESEQYGRWIDEGMPIIQMRMCNIFYQRDFLFNWTKYKEILDKVLDKLHNYTLNVVKEQKKLFRRNLKVQGGEVKDHIDDDGYFPRKSFLDFLLQLSHDGAEFSDEEMKDEIITLIAGGLEGITATMSFCSLLLGMHPEIQQRVYEEVLDVIGKDGEVTPKDLPRMQYMKRCIMETLRLFPLAPVIMRASKDDIDLGEFTIPETSTVLICTTHIHRNQKYWKDPLKFDPDRFSSEEIAKRHPYAYIPFSAGPRNCIGFKLGIIAMQTLLSELMRKFVLKTKYTSIEEVDLKMVISLRPVHGFNVWIEPRI